MTSALPGLELLHSVARMPGMGLPVCSPVASVEGGRVLISPGSHLSDETLRGLRDITDIVAPSLMHTAGMARAAAAHPGARVWGPRGLDRKVPGLRIHGLLGEAAWPHEGALQAIPVGGIPRVREHLFVHRASRALIVTDLVFNLEDAAGLAARLFLGIFGTYRRFAVSRLYAAFVKDRAALRQSLAVVLAADFDAIVPGHGAVVATGGRARLEAALRERGFVA